MVCRSTCPLLAALIAVPALLLLPFASVTNTPISAQSKVGELKEKGEVQKMTHTLRPSDITGRLVSHFQVCGQCPGETMPGQVDICPDVFFKAAHVVYYGASAWTEVGIKQAPSRLKGGAVEMPRGTVVACDGTGLPASVQFRKVCLSPEQQIHELQRLIVLRKPNIVGVLSWESVEWQLLRALIDQNLLKDYQMLIIKFQSFEIQSKHLQYLQVLEKLLTYFDLISTNGAVCDSWGVPGRSFLMPGVLWATFLRKDLVAPMATCKAQIPSLSNCTATGQTLSFSASSAPLPGGLPEPEEVFFEISSQFMRAENPFHVKYWLPYNLGSMDLLRSFRLCHTCRSGDLLRVGPRSDGGYFICQDSAVSSRVAISIGIRGSDPFGTDLSERFGIRVEGFDCTGSAFTCPKELKRCNFTFHNQCIGKPFGGKPPEQFISIGEVLDRYTKPDEEIILKIDCEGCEWNVLPEIPLEILQRFPMLVMEAHWLERQERHPQYLKTMQHLLQVFELVDSHACNCFGVWTLNGTDFGLPRIVELTFVRKDQAAAIPCVNSKDHEGIDMRSCNMFFELKADSWRLPGG